MAEAIAHATISLRCPSCGSDDALPTALRESLTRHLARVHRETDRLRAMLFAGFLSKRMGATGCRNLVLGIGGALMLGALAVVLGGPRLVEAWSAAQLQGAEAMKALGLAAAILITLVTGALLLATFAMRRVAKRAQADALNMALQETVDTSARCDGCGASVRIPVWQQRDALPCPYCRVPLLAPQSLQGPLRQIRAAQAASGAQRGAEQLAAAFAPSGGSRRRRSRSSPDAGPFQASAATGWVWMAEVLVPGHFRRPTCWTPSPHTESRSKPPFP